MQPICSHHGQRHLLRPDSSDLTSVKGLPRFNQALSRLYSPLYGRRLDPNKEISVHSGGTEAILSVITAFVEPGDEVVVMEPAFDLYSLPSSL